MSRIVERIEAYRGPVSSSRPVTSLSQHATRFIDLATGSLLDGNPDDRFSFSVEHPLRRGEVGR
jgi:hypothetical protein